MSALAVYPSPRTVGACQRAAAPGAPGRTPAAARHLSLAPPVVEGPAVVSKPAALTNPVHSARRVEPKLRLTTRGRRVLIALGFAVSIAIGATLGMVVHSDEAMPQEVTTVVVQPGQSLWVIASASAAPGQDVREVVDQIQTMNGLEHSTVHAGQQLRVPLG